MQLAKQFSKYIEENALFTKEDRLLVAVSGGVDSIVLSYLLCLNCYRFSVAHCNFGLRGEESDQDEALVKSWTRTMGARYHRKSWDTEAYAKKNKMGIQETARVLRYQWFEELRTKHDYQYLLTAHHQNDSIETFLFNFIKGTGIHGLHGILPKSGWIVRPLLCVTKTDILEFAERDGLKYREDASNLTDKYSRNFIRHHITPLMKQINPAFEQTAIENINRLKQAEALMDWAVQKIRTHATKQEDDLIKINVKQIQDSPAPTTVLYEIIKEYGFNPTQVTEILKEGLSGRQFYAPNHRLLVDREYFIIQSFAFPKLTTPLWSRVYHPYDATNGNMEFGKMSLHWNLLLPPWTEGSVSDANPNIASLDFDKLTFPLTIRNWQKGDKFKPYGMGGKTKKISDYFNNLKLSIFEKERAYVLLSATDLIAWVIGYRIDEQFKVTDTTKAILKLNVMT